MPIFTARPSSPAKHEHSRLSPPLLSFLLVYLYSKDARDIQVDCKTTLNGLDMVTAASSLKLQVNATPCVAHDTDLPSAS